MTSEAAYGRHNMAAIMAYHRGAHREAADEYLKAVLAAPDAWMPQDGIATRFHTFQGYLSILRENYFLPSKEELKLLENEFVDNEKEPVCFRVEAAFTVALMQYDKGHREDTAYLYRKALAIAETVTPGELEHLSPGTDIDPVTGQPKLNTALSIKILLQQTVDQIKSNLRILECAGALPINHPIETIHKRSDGTSYPKKIRNSFAAGDPRKSTEYIRRSAVGGSQCDACGKTLQELQRETLQQCSRCQMAYYCGEDCQKDAWRNGHKQACRKRGEIKLDDIMRLDGLQSKPELNGIFVKVVSEQANGRCGVELMDLKATQISVKPENLQHLRPAV